MNTQNLKIKLLVIFIIACQAICFQAKSQSFSLLFYNVENLFDTINNPHTKDDNFTPSGENQWNTQKYYRKLTNISRAIIASGEWQPPDIIGIAEIENKSCTRDLVNKTPLSRLRYEYIHHESPDFRGIDIALLYNPLTFTPLFDSAIAVVFPRQEHSTTRDILYVKGVIKANKDTLHVFMLHFPSRFGGTKKSEYKRIAATKVLLNATSEILEKNAEAHIIIMGDFNDEPHNKAPQLITNSMFSRLTDSSKKGTYVFRGFWQEIDHCYVSLPMLNAYTVSYSIISRDFLLQTDSKGNSKPFRSYAGPYYLGGYSDHLPILCTLQKN